MSETAEVYKCDHCNRTFKRASTLLVHMCETKRRFMDQNRPANRIAYNAWAGFYQTVQPGKRRKEYVDFIKNAYYSAFVRYGNYCVDNSVVNPLAYSNWLLKSKVRVDDWASDVQYTRYLIEYIKLEQPLEAVERTIKYLLDVAERENIRMQDVFRLYSQNRICHDITMGRISPWVLYHSSSGQTFLESINENQHKMIDAYINMEQWLIRFKRDLGDVQQVTELLTQAGL